MLQKKILLTREASVVDYDYAVRILTELDYILMEPNEKLLVAKNAITGEIDCFHVESGEHVNVLHETGTLWNHYSDDDRKVVDYCQLLKLIVHAMVPIEQVSMSQQNQNKIGRDRVSPVYLVSADRLIDLYLAQINLLFKP